MKTSAAKSGYESEGFQAHSYLSRAKEDASQWDYKAKSKLTSVLAEQKATESVVWRKVRTTTTVRTLRCVPKQLEFDFGIDEQEFGTLVETWRRETAHLSVMFRKAMHPAYQRIVGMGKDALPLILKEMQKRPTGAWFWALNSITGKDPAKSEETIEGAIQAWLQWGRKQRYI